MTKLEINCCPSTLSAGFDVYSPAGLRRLFDGKKVSPILPYDAPDFRGETEEFLANRDHISISGVQEKLSVLVEKGRIRLTESGEQGTHILKPISSRLNRAADMPANEHVTMQIAGQLFKIPTAENGLCFFQTGEPAYITKRFDVDRDGQKLRKEDFASLAGKTSVHGGSNFKYDYSYLEMGELIRRYILAWRVEMERFFRLVLFNFLFSNGDAHLKNFSVLETRQGDMLLSPAYDLLNTSLHINDSEFALSGGLYHGAGSRVDRQMFEEFGCRLGLKESRIVGMMDDLMGFQERVEAMIGCSFLSPPAQRAYILSYRTRHNMLKS